MESMKEVQEALPTLMKTVDNLRTYVNHIIEISSKKKINQIPVFDFLMTKDKTIKNNRGPLSVTQDQTTNRPRQGADNQARIDQLFKVIDKCREQKLLSEGLMTPEEFASYKNAPPRAQVRGSSPIVLPDPETDDDRNDHNVVETKKRVSSASRYSKHKPTRAPGSKYSSVRSKTLPRSGVRRRNNR